MLAGVDFHRDYAGIDSSTIMRQLPEAVKFRGSAKFSTMEPGTVVRPHFAIANDHVRLHLGIDVPEPDQTDLIVGGVRYGWM